MHALLISVLDAPGDLLPAKAGQQVVDNLRRNDPALLAGWLDECAVALVTGVLRDLNRARRSRQGHERPRTQFAAAAAGGALSAYRLRFMIADGAQRFLRDMTVDDCDFIAKTYTSRGDAEYRRAAFFDAVRSEMQRVMALTVATAFSDQQLTELWRSFDE
jgi:hypothetical protein